MLKPARSVRTVSVFIALALGSGFGCGSPPEDQGSNLSPTETAAALTSADAVPLYSYWNGKFHYYSTDPNVTAAGSREGVTGGILPTGDANSVPLYRYVYTGPVGKCGGAHYYTQNFSELGNGSSGWTYEGITGYVPTSGAGTTNLYRYFNPGSCDHYYTIDYNVLGTGAQGYQLEGIQSLLFGSVSVPMQCTPGKVKVCCPYARGCSCPGDMSCDATGHWGSCQGASPRGQLCQ